MQHWEQNYRCVYSFVMVQPDWVLFCFIVYVFLSDFLLIKKKNPPFILCASQESLFCMVASFNHIWLRDRVLAVLISVSNRVRKNWLSVHHQVTMPSRYSLVRWKVCPSLPGSPFPFSLLLGEGAWAAVFRRHRGVCLSDTQNGWADVNKTQNSLGNR